jgi:hypothetical protein
MLMKTASLKISRMRRASINTRQLIMLQRAQRLRGVSSRSSLVVSLMFYCRFVHLDLLYPFYPIAVKAQGD